MVNSDPIIIYTRNDPPCEWCRKTKRLLKYYGVQFEEIVIGEDIKRSEFMEKYPEIYSVPAVFFGERYIGGYEDLTKKIWTLPVGEK
tara:strand:- start:186 stop:446 length:261 start_codon:yes stop_codon:yes gene_type:complete